MSAFLFLVSALFIVDAVGSFFLGRNESGYGFVCGIELCLGCWGFYLWSTL